MGARPTINKLGLQTGTERTLMAVYGWTYGYATEYEVRWDYDTGDGVWFFGENKKIALHGQEVIVALYTFPPNAKSVKVQCRVRTERPIHGVSPNYGSTGPFVSEWSDPSIYKVSINSAEPAMIENTGSPTNIIVNKQTGASSKLYASWEWQKDRTDHYEYVWQYYVNGIWFAGSEGNCTVKNCTYSVPSNAVLVRFKVKAVSTQHKVNNENAYYWNGQWSGWTTYNVDRNTEPDVPSTPTVTQEGRKLTFQVKSDDEKTSHIEFRIVRDNSVFLPIKRTVLRNSLASVSITGDVGHNYKASARGYRQSNQLYSKYSSYTNIYNMPPATPILSSVSCISETEAQVTYKLSQGSAKSYIVEYTTNKSYFDSGGEVSSTTSECTYATITGLKGGKTYYFRVKAANDTGDSGWSKIVSCVIGTAPSAPTTWSSKEVGSLHDVDNSSDHILLYWIHNSEDGSTERYAELYMKVTLYTSDTTTVNKEYTQVIKNPSTDEDTVRSYTFNPYTVWQDVGGDYPGKIVVTWKVRTQGIYAAYGEWSITRTITIYRNPEIYVEGYDKESNDYVNVFSSFPVRLEIIPDTQASSQKALWCNITIKSMAPYKTTNNDGTIRVISKGDEIYSKGFAVTKNKMGYIPDTIPNDGEYNVDKTNEWLFYKTLTASDLHFMRGDILYELDVTVSFDSGLTATYTDQVTSSSAMSNFTIDAELSYNKQQYSMTIYPYSRTAGLLNSDIEFSIYRIEVNGELTLVANGVKNEMSSSVIDPHPTLNYARYRIIGTDVRNNQCVFYDTSPFNVGEKAAIIQWDETIINYDGLTDLDASSVTADPSVSGSILVLPYNIDISDSFNLDTNNVEYIGRKRPVSYYGTQRGHSSSWSIEIPKYDTETLNAIRRLSEYAGDVYVREPSGTGYWASIKPSFSINHNQLTIPVSFSITRVEGGV